MKNPVLVALQQILEDAGKTLAPSGGCMLSEAEKASDVKATARMVIDRVRKAAG